jgi:WD40 repeat protein
MNAVIVALNIRKVVSHALDEQRGSCAVRVGAVHRYCAQTLEGVALGHDSTVWDLSFDSAGERMASVSCDQTIKVWQCASKGGDPLYCLLATIAGHHNRSIFGVSWSRHCAIATACGATPCQPCFSVAVVHCAVVC